MLDVLASRPLPTATEVHDLVAKMRRKQGNHARGTLASARRISPMTLAMAASGPGGIGPAAWKLLLKGMPFPTLKDDANRVAAWRVLQFRDGSIEVPTNGRESPWPMLSVTVGFVVVGRVRGQPAVAEGTWSLVFSDHALHRMALAGETDLAGAMLQAHDALLQAPVSLAGALVAADTWALPAGCGVAVVKMRGALRNEGTDAAMLATAADWIPNADLTDAQRQQAASLVADHDERTLGARWLRPAPMRPACTPFTPAGASAPAADIPV